MTEHLNLTVSQEQLLTQPGNFYNSRSRFQSRQKEVDLNNVVSGPSPDRQTFQINTTSLSTLIREWSFR